MMKKNVVLDKSILLLSHLLLSGQGLSLKYKMTFMWFTERRHAKTTGVEGTSRSLSARRASVSTKGTHFAAKGHGQDEVQDKEPA